MNPKQPDNSLPKITESLFGPAKAPSPQSSSNVPAINRASTALPSNRNAQLIFDLLRSIDTLPSESRPIKQVLKNVFKLLKAEINEISNLTTRRHAYELVQGYKLSLYQLSPIPPPNLLEFSELAVSILGNKVEASNELLQNKIIKSLNDALKQSFLSVQEISKEISSSEIHLQLVEIDKKHALLGIEPNLVVVVTELLGLLREIDSLKLLAVSKYQLYLRDIKADLKAKSLQVENAYNRILLAFGRYIPETLGEFLGTTSPLSYPESISQSLDSIGILSSKLEEVSTLFPLALEDYIQTHGVPKKNRIKGNAPY